MHTTKRMRLDALTRISNTILRTFEPATRVVKLPLILLQRDFLDDERKQVAQ